MANSTISLSLKRDLKKIYKDGLVFRKKGVVLRCVKGTKGLRIAFGLSSKVIQTAVKRNKIKRWSRQILRETVMLKGVSLDILIAVAEEQSCYEFFKKNFSFLLEKALRKTGAKDRVVFHCFL